VKHLNVDHQHQKDIRSLQNFGDLGVAVSDTCHLFILCLILQNYEESQVFYHSDKCGLQIVSVS